MLKSFLLLSIFLQSGLLAAQQDYVKSYYPLIRKAENQITYLSYRQALRYYQQAFRAVKQPFALDYYNGILCAIQVKAYRKAGRYTGKLFDKGVDTTFFAGPVFTGLRNRNAWHKLRKTYVNRRKQYLNRIDTILRKEVLYLRALDQQLRQKEGAYQHFRDTIAKTDRLIINTIKHILAKHGYPDENQIGIVGNNLLVSPLSTIIRHYYQNGKADLSAPLLEQVKRGKLSPREYVQHEEAGEVHQYGDIVFTKLDTGLVVENVYSREKVEQLNQSRLQVGLEPLAEWKRKILFEFNQSLFLPLDEFLLTPKESFNFQAGYGVLSFYGDQTFREQFLQSFPSAHIVTSQVLNQQGIEQVHWNKSKPNENK